MTTMEVIKGKQKILKDARFMEGVEFIHHGKVYRGLMIGFDDEAGITRIAYFDRERNSWWEDDFCNNKPYIPCDVTIKFFGTEKEEEKM